MGIEIEINNSYSKTNGLNKVQLSALRKLLSYTKNPEAAFYHGGFIKKSYMIDKRGNFPTGLLPRVINWFKSSDTKYVLTDHRKIPATKNLFKLRAFTPYQWQSEASTVAYQHERGGIVAPTGTGKSATIVMILCEIQVPTLIVVPTLEIKVQLMSDISRLLGSLKHIRVENIDSSALENPQNVDCLIIDECHHAAAKTYQRLNRYFWNDIYYRFFLSATFFRNNINETLPFEAICGQEIYRLTYQEAVKSGYIVPVEAYYFDLPKKPNDFHTWREVFDHLVVGNYYRNLFIVDILQALDVTGKSTLCLVKEIEHGYLLSKLSGFPFVHGQDVSSRKHIQEFKNCKIKILIGTEGILGEGVDTKSAEYIIISGLGKAKSSFMQKIGRVIRVFPGKNSGKIIFFRDSSHKFCLTHWRTQCKILKEEYDVLPKKL